MELADLSSADDTTLREALEDLGIRGLDKAAVLSKIRELPTARQKDNSGTLADYFRAERARLVEPWRNAAEKADNIVKGIKRQSIEEQKELFLDMAKNAMLTEQEVLFGQYLFYGDTADVHLLRGLLLAARGADRIRIHNFVVASAREESFLRMHGEALQGLAFPLFPAARVFAALNEKLLVEVVPCGGRAPKAAGGTAKQRPSVYAARTDVDGGGALPVVPADNGSWVVDTTPIENAFGEIFSTLNALGEEVRALKDAAHCQDRLSELRGRITEARNTIRRAAGSRGRAYQGRGMQPDGRGRGFRGGRGPN